MRKGGKILLAVLIILILGILLGPRVEGLQEKRMLPEVHADLEKLEKEIQAFEAGFKLKADNEARIVWANDTIKQKTGYALVYLHGFSASQEEGDPLHEHFARRYGMNAFFARIAGHGLDTAEPFAELTSTDMLESALHALAVGHQIGEKVILMGCSTGATMSLYLAAHYKEDIAGLFLYSPNIDVFDPNAKVLTMPWGLQIARMVVGSPYREWTPPPPARQYWYSKYRLEGAAALKSLIDGSMTASTFQKIDQPLLMLYYYKNEQEQDQVVSIPHMKEMFDQIATPVDQKKAIPMPKTGHHVLTSKFFSKDIEGVEKATFEFAEEVLGLKSVVDGR
jgi:pimeloyl-ACP methyl ester carboxylesterase